MSDLNTDALKAIPGVIGSLVSMLFVKEDSWPRRILMWLGGAAFAYYGTPWVAPKVAIPEGLSGFLVGLTGMFVVAKSVEAWNGLALAPLLEQLLRTVLRLPPKENGQ